MTWARRISIAILAVIAVVVIADAVDNVHFALQRRRQKRTMANIRQAATRHEAGAPMGRLVDEWERRCRSASEGLITRSARR